MLILFVSMLGFGLSSHAKHPTGWPSSITVIAIPFSDEISLAEAASLCKLSESPFKLAGPTFSTDVEYLTNNEQLFLRYMPPDKFSYTAVRGGKAPFRDGSVVHHWHDVARKDIMFVLNRHFLPPEIESLLSSLRERQISIEELQFCERPFLQDCVPTIGYDVELLYIGGTPSRRDVGQIRYYREGGLVRLWRGG
jgi:hypothetical protein